MGHAHVKLGTSTMKNVIEFLVYDEYNKQCATIYFATNKRKKGSVYYREEVKSETIGTIPTSLKEEVEKLKKIAETALMH